MAFVLPHHTHYVTLLQGRREHTPIGRRSAMGPSPPAATTTAAPSPFQPLLSLDAALSRSIYHSCAPIIPRALLKALEVSGDGRFWFPIPIALLPLSYPSKLYSPLLLGLLLGFVLDLLVVGLLKHLARRPRPAYNDPHARHPFAVDRWSFPSGHSSRALFIANFLWLSRPSIDLPDPAARWIRSYYGGDPEQFLVVLVFLWSLATSTSRVLLGRHYVLDVVAGASIGVLQSMFVFYFLKDFYQ